MLNRSLAKARTLGKLPRWAFVLTLAACSKKPTAEATDAGPDAASGGLVKLVEAARRATACRAPGKGTSFTLGTEAERVESSDVDGGVEDELPFSVSLGNVVVEEGSFWVGAIDQRHHETHAVLAKIASRVDHGSVIDLGRVFGDAEPPRLALLPERVVVAVPDADAGGRVMKVGVVSTTSTSVEWLDSIAQGIDDSPVFSLASQGSTLLVAWDEIETKSRQGFVRWKKVETLAPRKGDAKARGAKVDHGRNDMRTPREFDAEAPLLTPRPTGFWLGFLASEEEQPVRVGVKLNRVKREPTESGEEAAVVDLGKRGIRLLALDSQGNVSGSPIVVTEAGSHVETFDMKTLSDGGVIIVYREARNAPGVEEDEATVVEVRPDGGASRLRVEDERLGVGVPLLLMPEATKSTAAIWIGIDGKAGDMSVLSYRPGSGRLSALFAEPALVGAEPVARNGPALLVARPRGKVVEFERLECDFDKLAAPSVQ